MPQPPHPWPQPPEPHDLGDAIAHVRIQLDRRGLTKNSPEILNWLQANGYKGWDYLELNGFRDLYRFLENNHAKP